MINLRNYREKQSVTQILKNCIINGFPDTKNDLPAAINPYFNISDTLRHHIQWLKTCEKDKIHESHIGVQGCLRRVGETVYWPGLNSEVTDFIQTFLVIPNQSE